MTNYYIAKLKSESTLFYVFTTLSILIPVFLFLIPWLPADETRATWFQRSGSAMIVFALLAEARAVNVFNILNPSSFVEIGFDEAKEKFYKHPLLFNLSSFILISLGTLIWEYGDLLF